MSISVVLKDVWLAYTCDEDALHPFFAVLGVAREHMKIIRGVFKQGKMVGGLDAKHERLW
jgi:hypothetical protein